jgi:hypothetical protein
MIKEQEDGNTTRVIGEAPLMVIAISPIGSGKLTTAWPVVPVIGHRRDLERMPPINWQKVIGHRSLPERIQAIS